MAQTVSLIRLGGGDIVLPFEGAVFRRSQIRDEFPDEGFVVLGFLDDSSRVRQVGVLARVSLSSNDDAATGYVLLRGLRRVSLAGATIDGRLVRPMPHKAKLGDVSNVKNMINALKSTLAKSSMGRTLRAVDVGNAGEFADILASLLIPTRDVEIKTELLEGTVERRLEIVTALVDSYVLKDDPGGGPVASSGSVAKEGDRFVRMLIERGASEETIEAVKQEFDKLTSMNEMHPSHAGQKAWIEIVCSIPWNLPSHHRAATLDEARRVLDSNHFGLADVKRRIVEYVAVLRMTAMTSMDSKTSSPAPILLLVGPPGTGKTSLAKSIADCVGRKFERISLGGVRDEAEIRGHRRTYIGSFPGKVVNALRRSGVSDPLILIDEVDKIALNNSGRGDVSSALLEILDPEQNMAFKDHYVDLPLDLSKVTFVCTANSLETVPAPLIDRCEVVELASYTVAEKRVIAERHLLPAVLRQCGLSGGSLKLTNEAVDAIILEYTKEAGVRGLRKVLEAIARDVVVSHVQRGITGDVPFSEVGVKEVRAIMGPPKFSRADASARTVGCATGLVWTPVGGLTQLVECLWVPNEDGIDARPLSSRLLLTGSAGEVLRESATIAISWLRANRDRLGVRDTPASYHIHLPAGAVPKDGPSAGITILVALFSLQTGRTVRPMMAFTGELSLLGQVLPVGGIKEKLIAAHTAGMQTVVLPKANFSMAKRCLEDEHLDGDLQVLPVSAADQVLEAAFGALTALTATSHALVSRM